MTEVPRRPKALDGTAVRRLAAEFVIIVVGVLVAFAVDDWRERGEERALASRLLEAVAVDVDQSVQDLLEATWSARARQSALVELMVRLGQPLPPRDEWQPWDELDLDSVGGVGPSQLAAMGEFERIITFPVFVQVFDVRTVAYDELRSTGALRAIESAEARELLVNLYTGMVDFAESNEFHRRDQFALQDAFEEAGVIAGDWLPEEVVLARLRASPRALAAIRRHYVRSRDQAVAYPQVADRIREQASAVWEAAGVDPPR